MNSTKFHDLSIPVLNSEEVINFTDFEGKKVLIVNVASECGFTKQYEDLEQLYQKYRDQLVVLGVPCNQFGGQEPGTEAEIATFCSSKFDVSFPMTTKVDVKGEGIHPVYKWLTSEVENGVSDADIRWNFNKIMVDENGKWLAHFGSSVNPMDEEITSYLAF